MQKINIAIFFLMSLFFIGCGQQPFPGNTIAEASLYQDINKNTGKEILRIPELNVIKTIEIGENLYQKINQISYNTYNVILKDNTQASLFNGGFIKTYKENSSQNDLLYKWQNKNAMCFYSGRDYTLNRPIKICLIDNDDRQYFTHAVYSYKDIKYPLTNIAKYEIKPTPPTFNQDSFKYQGLYQGKTDNKIKISFREFKDNMARPAFTQDIEYELDSKGTTTIGFKGLRIEVLKATNYDITYKVIKDYN